MSSTEKGELMEQVKQQIAVANAQELLTASKQQKRGGYLTQLSLLFVFILEND